MYQAELKKRVCWLKRYLIVHFDTEEAIYILIEGERNLIHSLLIFNKSEYARTINSGLQQVGMPASDSDNYQIYTLVKQIEIESFSLADRIFIVHSYNQTISSWTALPQRRPRGLIMKIGVIWFTAPLFKTTKYHACNA